MKTKIEHFRKLLTAYIVSLRDPSKAGQLVFVIIVLLISWSGVKAIQTNYALQTQISAIRQQNELKKLQNKNLELGNAYYKSNQYLELAARENFGLAAPGEKELIVPRNVALSYTSDIPATPATSAVTVKVPAYQNNFQAWVNFFLHRQATN